MVFRAGGSPEETTQAEDTAVNGVGTFLQEQHDTLSPTGTHTHQFNEGEPQEFIIDVDNVAAEEPSVPRTREPARGATQSFKMRMAASADPSQPLALSWHGLSYEIITGTKENKVSRTLLNNLTGNAQPGEMLAVMGPSGSGKTTFLNVLSGRHVQQGTIAGEVLLNGARRTRDYKRQSCYVEQDDHLFPNLTVREMIHFSAMLRLPASLTRAQKTERAEDVIRELGLFGCANTLIGSQARRGVSGGERKRASIAVELITNPRLIFLDEPTSGLDSNTAFNIIETMQFLARTGRTVICTIHQPQAKLFQLFDKLVLLSKGNTCYYGPVAAVPTFFASLQMPCPPQANVADHILDIVTVDSRSKEQEDLSLVRLAVVTDAFRSSILCADAAAASHAELQHALLAKTSDAPADERLGWNLPWLMEMALLLKRAWLNMSRDPRAVKAACGQAILMGLIVGFLFFRLGHDQDGVRDRYSVLFFILLNQSFTIVSGAAAFFHQEKLVVARERSAGAYRVSSYYISKSIAEIPIVTAFPLIHVTMVYWLADLRPDAGSFFTFLLIFLVVIITAQSFGFAISSVTPTYEVANIVVPVCMIFVMLFGGFYLSNRSIWIGFVWLQHVSFIKYGYTAVMVNEFSGTTWSCATTFNCLDTGSKVLANMGMDGTTVWAELGKLLALAIGMRIMAYVFLLVLRKEKLRLA